MPRRRQEKRKGIRWVNVMLAGVLFGLVAVVVGVFGLWWWLKSYLHGEEFLELVGVKTSSVFKAEGEFEEMHWTGSSVYSDGYAATGYEDAPFSSIAANGIRAFVDFGAVRDGVWKISEIQLNQLTLVMKAENRLAGTAPELGELVAAVGVSPGILPVAALMPKEIEIGEVRIAEGNLLAQRNPKEGFALKGVETTVRPVAGSDAWSVSGRGGTMEITNLPTLEVESFATRLRAGELFVTDAAFTFLEGARLAGSGEMRFGEGGGVDLKMRFAELETKKVLSANWKEKISGKLHGKVDVVQGAGEELRQAGTINLTHGVIEGLSVLDQVADYAKAERFRRLVLHEAKGDFVRTADRLEITELVLQSDGLTRLTGDLIIEGGQVAGDFRVGVTPGTLKWIPGAEQKVFTEPADGFLWTHMRVAGPVENPSEDLSLRLKTAAVQTVVEDAVNGVIKGTLNSPEKAVETGKTLLDTATEEGKKLLETVTPFFR